ncbi:hypothetical protein GGI25_005456 [Coemansia spiralis]|uniref:PB1 domain-containing protein n=2 Tax=Coemansia TaxID=4863 RepID=A0A9W8KWG3_9FUNG|nr:hypothetical protein BX070DRAFT_109268 [Coemansia spiralis]KAJ1988222.1 hypothetical protein EDC05_005422 [Coemansia umbellata]KAJ2619629.1 hypothetical protein GGI26_005683 [Coemansia sp. RSA 1358]KAJ2671589.1 hypothetical protein GGI25_005456 [Coemansia spiralis]
MLSSKTAFVGTVTGTIREEQKARVLESGGRVLKFTNNGGKLYFRYYFPHPQTLTWNKLTSGLRVLYSINSPDLYIRYIDIDGTKITVNDDSGLRIMFDETKSSDVIRIEVVSEDMQSNSSSLPNIDAAQLAANSGPKMTMPMPMPPSGFPGMDASRPPSALSNHTTATAQARPPQPMLAAMPPPQAFNRLESVASMSTMNPPLPQKPLP